MSQPPPPPPQSPSPQHNQSPFHPYRLLPSSPSLAGRQQLHSVPPMIGTPSQRSSGGFGARELPPLVSHLQVYHGSSAYRSFAVALCISARLRKRPLSLRNTLALEMLLKARVKFSIEILVLNPCISYASMRSHGFIDGENYTHRKVYQLHCDQR